MLEHTWLHHQHRLYGSHPVVFERLPAASCLVILVGMAVWWRLRCNGGNHLDDDGRRDDRDSKVVPPSLYYASIHFISPFQFLFRSGVGADVGRAAMFFQFGVAVMGSEFISTAVSSWLMTHNPWIPVLLGWGIIIVSVLLVLTLPETMHASTLHQPATSHELANLPANTDDGHYPSSLPPPIEKGTMTGALQSRVKSMFSTYAFVIARRPLVLLLSAFLVYRLSRGTAWFLVQYVSVRYGWNIAQANLLVSLKSILMVVLFLFVLPFLSRYLTHRRGTDSRQKDLILTKFSIISLMVGTLGMGLSPHVWILITCLVIQSLGAGFVYSARSLITSMVQRERTARLYIVIEIIQALGSVLASAAMTTMFNWGLDLGGFWIGLAWMIASALFGIIAVVIWSVKPPPAANASEDSDERTQS
jgi:hypothetical protein